MIFLDARLVEFSSLERESWATIDIINAQVEVRYKLNSQF